MLWHDAASNDALDFNGFQVTIFCLFPDLWEEIYEFSYGTCILKEIALFLGEELQTLHNLLRRKSDLLSTLIQKLIF